MKTSDKEQFKNGIKSVVKAFFIYGPIIFIVFTVLFWSYLSWLEESTSL